MVERIEEARCKGIVISLGFLNVFVLPSSDALGVDDVFNGLFVLFASTSF